MSNQDETDRLVARILEHPEDYDAEVLAMTFLGMQVKRFMDLSEANSHIAMAFIEDSRVALNEDREAVRKEQEQKQEPSQTIYGKVPRYKS